MRQIDAFHLPRLRAEDVDRWETRVVDCGEHGTCELRWPLLTPEGVRRIARGLRSARHTLRSRTTEQIINAIGRAVPNMRADPSWDITVHAIAATTGYSVAMARHVIERMAQDWTARQLRALINADIGGTDILDGFARRGSARITATGPDLSFHVFSGNVPGVAVTSIIRALLVKSPVFSKTAWDEPILAAAFARALRHVDDGVGDAISVTYWPGGTEQLESAALDEADLLIHYGSAAALASLRARAPAHVRVVEHGPRISFGIVRADALNAEESARRIAIDIAMAASVFDQQGCVSPHTVFVERGRIDAQALARFVAEAMRTVAEHLPAGELRTAEAAAVRRMRDEAEMRMIAGEGADLHGDERLGWTVIFDPDARLTATCLHRTLVMHPVDDALDVIKLIQTHAQLLQTCAIASVNADEGLARALADAGVTRITSFREMPWPPPEWHHDGRGALTELLRFTDLSM